MILSLLLASAIALEPNIGTTSGGDILIVHGTLIRSCTIPLCPPAEILLDGVPLQWIPGPDNRFVTPPHPPGPATLTTRRIPRNPEVANAFTDVGPFDNSSDPYEPILFPL